MFILSMSLISKAFAPDSIFGRDNVLAKLCRGKINRLFSRMTAQLELAVKRGKDATTPVIQLAVLGVVKHLRLGQSNFAWLPRGEKLVDPEHECEFFKEASRLLYAPACGLSAKALAVSPDCPELRYFTFPRPVTIPPVS
jgi:hypothetical protein